MITGSGRPAGDEFGEWDAAYVLGALAPSEHAAYEAHLAECQRCRASVATLAAMPGLLGRVAVDQLSGEDFDPVPSAVLPRLLARAAHERRRDRWRLATAGLVAAACLLTLVVAAVTSGRRGFDSAGPGSPVSGARASGSSAPSVGRGPGIGAQSPTTSPAPTLTLTPVGHRSVVATAQIQSVAWGTRIKIRCVHRSGGEMPPPRASGTSGGPGTDWYALVIVDKSDHTTQLSSWSGRAATVEVEGDTALRRDQIVRLLVLDEDKEVVLKLAV